MSFRKTGVARILAAAALILVVGTSDQPRYTVGFETYKVLLYNTTDKTVTVNLYAYLSS